MSSRLRVDWTMCEAHGLCAEMLPELIALDEWGYPVINDGPIPAQFEDHARRTVDICPTLALKLEKIRSPR